jgi:predicted double-glycine peptidase
VIVRAIFESVGVLLLACLCAWAGVKITRLKSKVWIAGFFVPFSVIFSIILLNRIPTLVYHAYFARIAEGRNEFILMAICMPFIFGILIPRLQIKRQKIVVGIFAAIASAYFVIPPFLDPALLYAEMKNSETWIEDGVCIQTTSYTCGAASAVTALMKLGINASEAELALASYTSRTWGASAPMLSSGIRKLYQEQGISCEIRVFNTVEQLKDVCPVLVIVKYKPLMDHYIAVLEVNDDFVVVGDPLKGTERLAYEEFMEKWRQVGIIVSKENADT